MGEYSCYFLCVVSVLVYLKYSIQEIINSSFLNREFRKSCRQNKLPLKEWKYTLNHYRGEGTVST